jgi:hypothetical protein
MGWVLRRREGGDHYHWRPNRKNTNGIGRIAAGFREASGKGPRSLKANEALMALKVPGIAGPLIRQTGLWKRCCYYL